jgi:hypothetical protein
VIRLATLTAVLAVLVTGCGSTSGKHTAAGTTTTSPAVAVTASNLRNGVTAALRADHRLALRVLWTNVVPLTATRSTRGPALAGMRASAKGRQQEQIRVRMLHDSYRIISIQLDPSYASATAIAQSNQNLRLAHLDGRAAGPATEVNERARIDLHRIGTSSHFVVWRLTVLK